MPQFKDTSELWNALKKDLQGLFSEDIFETWFQPLRCQEGNLDEKLIFLANNDFASMWLQNNYLELFETKIANA